MQNIVIVTGGNRGIGLDITQSFANAGYTVVIGARQEPRFSDEFGDRVVFVKADVRDEESHLLLVRRAQELGTLTCYINNAGYSEWRPIEAIDADFLDDIMNTNVKGAFWGAKAAASVLEPGGCIINISSLAGKRGSSNNSAYCATKFAMNGMTQALAKELGPRGIRVNAVCPVLIPTDGLLEALRSPYAPGQADPLSFIEKFAADNAALKRLPTGAEVGAACLYLASASASAITGQCINVDCGVLPQ